MGKLGLILYYQCCKHLVDFPKQYVCLGRSSSPQPHTNTTALQQRLNTRIETKEPIDTHLPALVCRPVIWIILSNVGIYSIQC